MTAMVLLLSTFVVVFALGLQSLNVNRGHLVLAAVTSLFIGTSNLVLFKVLPGPTDAWQIAAYLAGGPLGIVASMLAHPHLVRLLAHLRPDAEVRDDAAGYRPGAATVRLALRLLDPEDLAHSATPEIREAARRALGLQTTEAAPGARR